MATYPTLAQIDDAVPVGGIPDRTKTNAVLKALAEPPTFGQVTGKPATYPPSAHTHAFSQITDVPAALTAAQAAGTASIRAIGTGATQAAAGNHTHAAASGTASGFMTPAQFTKLADLIPFKLAAAAPAAIDSPGTQWELFVDVANDVIYFCVATDTWRTIQLTSWP